MTYSSLRLQSESVDAFRRLARQLAAEADRDVPLSEALTLLVALGNEHRAELIALAYDGLTSAPQSRNPGAGTAPVQPSASDASPDARDGGNRS